MTPQEIARLEEEVERDEQTLQNKKDHLEYVRRICRHAWGDVLYDPIVREGFRFEGDPPGTMGIDRRLPCYIPREETKQWKRTCEICGKVETTKSTKTETQPGKIPGTTAHVEVPQFYG